MTSLQPASMTPEPTNKPCARNAGYRMRCELRSKYSTSLFTTRASSSLLAPELAQDRTERFDFAFVQSIQTARNPAFTGFVLIREESGGEFPQVLARMIKIANLNAPGKC